jgi:hypothetical protein
MTLTQHGIKKICELQELTAEMMTLQLIDWTPMDKKGIAGRAQLSDGVSSMTCMVSKTMYQ